MLVVNTKEQLKKAKDNKVKEFMVTGELAEKLLRAQKISKLSKPAAVALAGAVGAGAVAAPFTAGTSLGVAAFASTAAATTVGTGTIIAAIAVGGVLLAFTIFRDYSIEVIGSPPNMTIRLISKHHDFPKSEPNSESSGMKNM